MVHDVRDGKANVTHAKPGAEVLIEALDAVPFDGLFVVRLAMTVVSTAATP